MKTQLIYIKNGTTLKGKPINAKSVHEVGEDVSALLIGQQQAEPYDHVRHKDAVLSDDLKKKIAADANAAKDVEDEAKAKAKAKAKETKK